MRACLILLSTVFLLVGCAVEPTPTSFPSNTPNAVATEVALIKATVAAETARAPTLTHTATDTATPTATATETPTPTRVPPSQLEGQVLDESRGQPLAGAQVTVGERQVSTGPDGRFVFPDLPPGQYAILVTAPDHDPVLSGIVEAGSGRDVLVNVELPAAGAGQYPEDPMATNQIDPAGAPTESDAERLARLQGFQGQVVSI